MQGPSKPQVKASSGSAESGSWPRRACRRKPHIHQEVDQMKRAFMTLLVPFALAACGTAATNYGGGTAPSSASGAATISVAGSSLGQILVDEKGKTLYLFEADSSTRSTCSAACAQAWPPVTTTGAPKAASSASP